MGAVIEPDRNRLLRFQECRRFFRFLFRGLDPTHLQKLTDLALDYWDHPERFA